MADFCECGSLIIDSRCSNKHCSLRAAVKPASTRKSTVKAKAAAKAKVKNTDSTLEATKPAPKIPNIRRASKCITYNLYETKNNEHES